MTPASQKRWFIRIGIIWFVIFFVGGCTLALHERHINQEKYDQALQLIQEEKWESAVEILEDLDYFKDTKDYLDEARSHLTVKAIVTDLMEQGYLTQQEVNEILQEEH